MESEFVKTIKKLDGKQLMALKVEVEIQSNEIKLEMYRRIRNE